MSALRLECIRTQTVVYGKLSEDESVLSIEMIHSVFMQPINVVDFEMISLSIR